MGECKKRTLESYTRCEMTIEEEYGTKVAGLVDGFDSTMHMALASMLKKLMDESYELGFKNGFAEGRKIGGEGK